MAINVNLKDLERAVGGDGNEFFEYKVQKGDTLGEIASFFGTTVEVLMLINPIIKNKNLIKEGWILLVPVV